MNDIQAVDLVRTGGCLCGSVRFRLKGEPSRSGLCHCLDCRKASGSHYAAFAVWPSSAVEISGAMTTFAERSFCPACGSRIAWIRDDEAEIMLGALDGAPTDIAPQYELWTGRREQWLLALPWTDQFEGDRTETSRYWRQSRSSG